MDEAVEELQDDDDSFSKIWGVIPKNHRMLVAEACCGARSQPHMSCEMMMTRCSEFGPKSLH